MADSVLRSTQGGEPHFRWRGTSISRIENVSDAVFGLAITLLVVASAVPESFAQLKALLRDFVPFGVCVLLMGFIWNTHYTFFRRFGLEDGPTMLINALLLFVLVFFLYPLKFLAALLFDLLSGAEVVAAQPAEADQLLAIYCFGYLLVFGLLAALYLRALSLRARLALTPVELLITRRSLWHLLVHAACAASVLIVATATTTRGFAGALFFLIGPAAYAVGHYFDRRIRSALEQNAAAP